jgi:hypothetical protein
MAISRINHGNPEDTSGSSLDEVNVFILVDRWAITTITEVSALFFFFFVAGTGV